MLEFSFTKKLNFSDGNSILSVTDSINRGEITTLFGPSGSGKTSILRMIAGFTKPDAGFLKFDDVAWFDSQKKINLEIQKRNIGFVFQDFALFPNMTVKENLVFALHEGQTGKLVKEVIDLVELGELKDRKPNTLSGGQKQRIALARAVIRKPSILLLDEAFSALDDSYRERMQDYILRIKSMFNPAIIMVSHDVSEVQRLSNKVIKLENGKIVARGTFMDVFSSTSDFSGKFKFIGKIISIEKEDIVNIVTLLIGSELVNVVASDSDLVEISVGDKVMVLSKAINPIIRKIQS